MIFKCPYSADEIILRAKSWVGKSISRAEWRRGETCIHLVSFAYGWQEGIPIDWAQKSIEEIGILTGWALVKRDPAKGDLGVFNLKDKDHLAIFTDSETMIYAGSTTFVESRSERFKRYYKGVFLWH